MILAFTVLSAGQAKLTSRITPDKYESHVANESEQHSGNSLFSPATRRKIHGWVNVLCGVMLLWPSRRRAGAAVSTILLFMSVVQRLRTGLSIVPPLVMMGLSAVVWLV